VTDPEYRTWTDSIAQLDHLVAELAELPQRFRELYPPSA